MARTPLIEGYEFLYDYPAEIRRIHRAHRVCTVKGHLWEMEGFQRPATYRLRCAACHPHISARKVVKAYNLFDLATRND